MKTTSLEAIEEGLEVLQASKDKWTETGINERIAILDEIKRGFLSVSDRWVELCIEAKGVPAETYGEVFEWNMLQVIFSLLASLRQSLRDIEKFGHPQISGPIFVRSDGQVAAQVFPRSWLEGMFLPDLTMEVWMEPGVSVEETLQMKTSIYRDKHGHGGVSLVLGAGNASALQVADLLYKLFITNHVVLLKINPVSAYLEPLLGEAFQALTGRGFLRVVCGGVEEGSFLCHHTAVDDIHLTGSDKTFEAIVFGSGEEGAKRKAEKSPLMTKPITGELGNITPVIIVPGPWSDDDVRSQAVKLVSWLASNVGCNCFTPRVIVQREGWAQREALTKAIGDVMVDLETRIAYYPGSRERHEAFVSAHPDARHFGDASHGRLPWTLIEGVNPKNADDICFKTEAFCSLITETALEADSIPEFIDRAVDFVNGTVWGTLTATILVHPKSFLEPEISASLERALTNLRYGTVSINELGVIAYFPGTTPWGGYPGHDIYDVQSGIGVINNYLMFDRPEKTVMRGPFVKNDPLLVTFRHAVECARKYAFFTAEPSIPGLLGLIWTLSKG